MDLADRSTIPVRYTDSRLVFGLFVVVLGLASLAITHKQLGTLLRGWDAQFYYAQAHSLVYRGTPDLTSSIEDSPWAEDFGPDGIRNLPRQGSSVINKYPVGISLIEAPLLLLGRLTGPVIQMPSDAARAPGWTAVSVLIVAAGLFLMSAIGLCALYIRLTREFGSLAAITGVVCCWIGTSLFYYSAVNPFMAHGAAFALVVLLVLQAERIHQASVLNTRAMVLAALTSGLLFLVRPQQILLVPVLAAIWPRSVWLDRRNYAAIIWSAAVFTLVCLVQPLFHFINVGRFSFNAYADGGEVFHWFHPDWYTVLLSSHRGLLFFSPVVIVAAVRLLYPQTLSFCERVFLAHGVVQIYLIMCWSSPEQGNSFGARMWCEAAPLVAFFIARLTVAIDRSGVASFTAAWRTVCCIVCLWTVSLVFVFVQNGGIREEQTHREILKLAIQPSAETKIQFQWFAH